MTPPLKQYRKLPFRKYILFLSLCLLNHVSSFAQDKYQVMHWEVRDGLSANECRSIIKDHFGFVWFAQYGLSRFDGKKFINYVQPCDLGLVEDSLHNIWIGSRQGISRFDILADSFSFVYPAKKADTAVSIIPFYATNNEIYCVENASQISVYNIHTLGKKIVLPSFKIKEGVQGNDLYRFHYSILDPSGSSVWILDGAGISELTFSDGEKHFYALPSRKDIKDNGGDIPGMVYDSRRKAIWLNTTAGIVSFDLRRKQFDMLPELKYSFETGTGDAFPGISIDPRGRIWFARGMPVGIQVYDPDMKVTAPASKDSGLQQKVSEDNMCLYCDREGTVWTGKWSRKGVYQLNPMIQTIQRFTGQKNKPATANPKIFNSLANGPSGNIWMGSEQGLFIFDPLTSSFRVIKKENAKGISGDDILVLAVDTVIGKAWVACNPPYRLFQLDLKTLQSHEVFLKDISGKIIHLSGYEQIDAVHFKKGCVFSVRSRGLFSIQGTSMIAKEFIQYTGEDVTAIATGDDKFIFLRIFNADNCRTYLNEGESWRVMVTPIDSSQWFCIKYDREDHSYWVGGIDKLLHYDAGFKRIPVANDSASFHGSAIIALENDRSRNIWINTAKGAIGVFEPSSGKLTNLEEKDGYELQFFSWNNPRIRDIYGNIYFAGDDGLDRIIPSALKKNFPPSGVYFLSLEVNGEKFSAGTGINDLRELNLKYFQNRISIETGIINFYSKGNSSVRYKMESSGGTWQYAPDYYTIRYEGLQPGNYRLVFQASNANGEFNGPEKKLTIHISPPFWETFWFRSLVFVFFLSALYAFYRRRTATLRKQKRVLEQTVKERTAEVVEEKAEVERQKEKSDQLLLNILPFEVAEELKEKGFTTAKSFDEVTILFSDIKGFTHVAERLSATELVKEIDTYFSAFDRIMERYGLEKIKTIGDAYIAAGGLPEKNSASVKDVVDAAISMQTLVEDFKRERQEKNIPYFELRIGIHTGPVVAGVVGIKKFQYDIWGDTVNMAARMEQSGVPGKINISETTFELIRKDFKCIPRGRVDAKNKGEVEMYFVERQ